jgi:hypothetical protein
MLLLQATLFLEVAEGKMSHRETIVGENNSICSDCAHEALDQSEGHQ